MKLYPSSTIFKVEVGKDKGSYKTRYSFTGDMNQALFYYHGINVGKGYKKRLVINNRTVMRDFS